MPRKVPTADEAAITALVQPPPPSPIVQTLRKDWRWAAISQFLFTFADAFGSFDFDTELLEADFDGSETDMIPDLIVRLLVALTWNRQINRETSFDHLRTQYEKRAPEKNPLGTKEAPLQWETLGLGQKVGVLWDLCEWQFVEPARFRSLLKSEDEAVSWRVDPFGWDKAGNTYFLFDDNRLWIQREPPAAPRPPKKSSQKAKKAAKAQRRAESTKAKSAKPEGESSNLPTSSSSRSLSSKLHRRRERTPRATPPPAPMFDSPVIVSGSRSRRQVEHYGNPTPTAQALKRGSATVTPKTDRSTRASGRLSGVGLPTESPSKPAVVPSPPIPRGTRISRRLRDIEDEWQPIPDEWLQPGDERVGATANGGKKRARAADGDGDNESELTDLTDELEHQAKLVTRVVEEKTKSGSTSRSRSRAKVEQDDMEGVVENGVDSPLTNVPDDPEEKDEAEFKPETNGIKDEAEMDEEDGEGVEQDAEHEEEEEDEKPEEVVDDLKVEAEKRAALPETFIEWEAVCVTLYDWKTFPEQFARSRDPDERALHTVLSEAAETIVPMLVEKEKERIREIAVLNRKRSSRIALKELEREAAMRREAAQREMEERMERSRFEAERVAQEAAEALARERAREERLREREERLAARQQVAYEKAQEEERIRERAEHERAERKRRREAGESDPGAGTSRGVSEADAEGEADAGSGISSSRWELACEVCGVNAWNPPEDADLVCCDDCGRWQHTKCHDARDVREGKGLRDWDQVDFVCQECKTRARVGGVGVGAGVGAGAGVGQEGSAHVHGEEQGQEHIVKRIKLINTTHGIDGGAAHGTGQPPSILGNGSSNGLAQSHTPYQPHGLSYSQRPVPALGHVPVPSPAVAHALPTIPQPVTGPSGVSLNGQHPRSGVIGQTPISSFPPSAPYAVRSPAPVAPARAPAQPLVARPVPPTNGSTGTVPAPLAHRGEQTQHQRLHQQLHQVPQQIANQAPSRSSIPPATDPRPQAPATPATTPSPHLGASLNQTPRAPVGQVVGPSSSTPQLSAQSQAQSHAPVSAPIQAPHLTLARPPTQPTQPVQPIQPIQSSPAPAPAVPIPALTNGRELGTQAPTSALAPTPTPTPVQAQAQAPTPAPPSTSPAPIPTPIAAPALAQAPMSIPAPASTPALLVPAPVPAPAPAAAPAPISAPSPAAPAIPVTQIVQSIPPP